MMPDPNVVFSTDPRHGLVARSGWEQEEARTVLREPPLPTRVAGSGEPTVRAGVRRAT